MRAQLATKPSYSPREFGERLDPPRSGQWVLVRIWNGELDATKTGSGWRLSHNELRRFGGQDLAMPGHEETRESTVDRDKVRELRIVLARAQALLAELEA